MIVCDLPSLALGLAEVPNTRCIAHAELLIELVLTMAVRSISWHWIGERLLIPSIQMTFGIRFADLVCRNNFSESFVPFTQGVLFTVQIVDARHKLIPKLLEFAKVVLFRNACSSHLQSSTIFEANMH